MGWDGVVLALLVQAMVALQTRPTSILGQLPHQVQLHQKQVAAAPAPPPLQHLHLIQAVNHVQEFGKLSRFPTNAVPVSTNHMKAKQHCHIRFPFP